MKIIFAGTPTFAAACLQALLNSKHQVVAVYTQPDRPAGRGQKITASPVKQLASAQQIPVCQPTTLRNEAEQQQLKNWEADIMIVVAYGLILPPPVLTIPHLGCLNVHASLLPRWRGAAPIQRAILAGDTTTGITIMQMDAGLDTGPMLQQVSCPIEATDTSQELYDRLAELGANTLLQSLEKIANGSAQMTQQDPTHACYAHKIAKHEAEINWQQPAAELERLIRAFNPWPVAYTLFDQQNIRIWQATVLAEKTTATPGTLVQATPDGIDVAAGAGSILRLLQIQLPGGKHLAVADVLHAKHNLFITGKKFGS